MELKKIHKILISIIVVLILFSLYVFMYRKLNNTSVNSDTINFDNSTTTEGVLVNGVKYKIEKVDSSNTAKVPQPIPDLNRLVVKSQLAVNVTEKDVEVASLKVKELQTILKKNPSDFSAWLDLAMYQKAGGDFDGAIITWEYAGKLSPSDYISIANIGNLYAYDIKDNTKAIYYYEKAINKSPKQVYLYTQLAGIYFDIIKDKTKALEIINRGLKNIPNDETLLNWKDILK